MNGADSPTALMSSQYREWLIPSHFVIGRSSVGICHKWLRNLLETLGISGAPTI